jgi:hypothetical protein
MVSFNTIRAHRYVGRTQRPNLSGDVLELAETLGNGVGCLAVNARPLTASSNWLTAVVLLL